MASSKVSKAIIPAAGLGTRFLPATKASLKEILRISELANFSYVRQRQARGLGHAILCAQHLIGDEPFAVLLGDEIIDAGVPAIAQLMDVYDRFRAPIIGV